MRRSALAVVVLLVAAACGETEERTPNWFRISGEGGIGPSLTIADVARGSVRADASPETGGPVVYLAFTSKGNTKFARLTANLAHRGATEHRPFHLILAVDGRVIQRPFIDYKRDPGGLTATSGIQLNFGELEDARDLAKRLRGD